MTEKNYKQTVELLFGDERDPNIESSYYEERQHGPDKFHVVFRGEMNEKGYRDWMYFKLSEFNISKNEVYISIWNCIDTFLDNFCKMEKAK